MSGKGYSPEEVDEILRRALARQQDDVGRVKRDELVEAAAEVGIDATDVDAAIREMEAERAAKTSPGTRAVVVRSDDDEARAARRRQLRGFYRHLGVFLVVNFALFMMDMLSSGGTWFFWPLLGWGIGLGSHAVNVLFPKEPSERKLSRRERKRLARDKAFEDAVERGLERMLPKHARVDAAAMNARVRADEGAGTVEDEREDERGERQRQRARR